jgi:hypothetical protein
MQTSETILFLLQGLILQQELEWPPSFNHWNLEQAPKLVRLVKLWRISVHGFLFDLCPLSFLCRILVGCGFTGEIPKEIGQLSNLIFL